MHLRRRAIAQGLMWTPSVVAFKPALQSRLKLHQRSVFPQVNLFILKAAPEPFDEHIIHPAPFAIHADADPELGEFPPSIPYSGFLLFIFLSSCDLLKQ